VKGTVLSDLGQAVRVHDELALWLTLFSFISFVASVIGLPWLVARAPADYFVREREPRHGLSLLRAILRNAVGLVLLLGGVLMLVLPGQGLLAIVVALSLLDVPGKRRLLRRLVTRPGVARALTWLRRRAGQPPFDLPVHD
jgi:hypothetical protein